MCVVLLENSARCIAWTITIIWKRCELPRFNCRNLAVYPQFYCTSTCTAPRGRVILHTVLGGSGRPFVWPFSNFGPHDFESLSNCDQSFKHFLTTFKQFLNKKTIIKKSFSPPLNQGFLAYLMRFLLVRRGTLCLNKSGQRLTFHTLTQFQD